MEVETGKIHYLNKDGSPKIPLIKKLLLEIDEKDMTRKQKREMQVSLKDHKSVLGKKLTKARKNLRRRLRQKIAKIK